MTAGVEAATAKRVFREEYGRILASLIRALDDFDAAEEALQDAFTAALQVWPVHGVPHYPGAWITTTAQRKAIDRARRERLRSDREGVAGAQDHAGEDEYEMLERRLDGTPEDDRLRLIFTCCHPALGQDAQVALTLNTLGGLQTQAIARAFLVPRSTLAQRLVRAKHKIRAARIPYRVPPDHLLPERMPAVLSVLYLIFNEGYASSGGDTLIRQDLCGEAIRLARVLAQLMPDEPEALGLLALMLLHDARRAARTTPDGDPVLLADQDRGQWDHGRAAEGRELLEAALRRRRPGVYQLQGAIAAVHSEARCAAETDWQQIVALYDALLRLHQSPVIALNRAVAVSMVDGPARGLELVAGVGATGALDEYLYFHSTRADLLRRLGDMAAAADAYDRALELAGNAAERRFLAGRRGECRGQG